MIRSVLFVLAIAAFPASAQTSAERLHELAEQMVEREFDLTPARETYAEGAGPRAGKAVVDLSPGIDQRHGALYKDVLEPGDYVGYPIQEKRRWVRTLRVLDQILELREEVRELSKRVGGET